MFSCLVNKVMCANYLLSVLWCCFELKEEVLLGIRKAGRVKPSELDYSAAVTEGWLLCPDKIILAHRSVRVYSNK